ncbi:PREDICTED: uncharacterized protein LOC104705925 [Camelina sativa]|uniref:Uncharacterized protein LOC104705925 n=1 Tax=Camelina sativa TaxID=90675 RepID=A0ABM0T3F2_CAMSA|nr:PREDICTED: uncharacterized protein LOC104705925 [Camelina sativa]
MLSLVKSRKAISCALPSEPSPSTSVAAVSAVSGDHRSRCLSLIVKLGGRGLVDSAREVISRVIDGSSSISEAALVVDFAGNNGIELDSCCCGALIRKLTEMGQPGLAETFYNERVIGNEEELLKLLLVLTGGSCEYWYSRRWPRDYGRNNIIWLFCLDHRSYMKHDCPKGNRGDVTVVICPFCATAVRLNPDEVPNLAWEEHVNSVCDHSNDEKAVKKKKICPVPRCGAVLTFSYTIKCRDCDIDHCLKHRFGSEHSCSIGYQNPLVSFNRLLHPRIFKLV